MKTTVLSLLFFLIVLQFSFSDNIRGPVKRITTIDSGPIGEIILSSEDIFAIVLDNEDLMPVRIQLEVILSDTLRNNPNTFALFFYNNLTPAPRADISNYTGNLVKHIVLPRRNRHFIDIHLQRQPARSEIIPGTDIIVPRDFRGSIFPIVVAMLPIMKGIPSHLLNETINVRITPFFSDRGSLTVNVFERSNSPHEHGSNRVTDFRLFIDNTLYESSENIILPIGIRRVRIEKNGYTTFEESILINNNEKNTLTAHLTREQPHVIIQAPREAQIFINGVQHRQREFSNLGVGEHTFVFIIGEYSISRRITLERGKRYLIDILLDIDVTEF
ncbi:MAG: hypothetical protein FWD87_02735 [Spirochaetaceae bacterium]|nr:hypothetical protein [Spirochaetaceae bacterium]